MNKRLTFAVEKECAKTCMDTAINGKEENTFSINEISKKKCNNSFAVLKQYRDGKQTIIEMCNILSYKNHKYLITQPDPLDLLLYSTNFISENIFSILNPILKKDIVYKLNDTNPNCILSQCGKKTSYLYFGLRLFVLTMSIMALEYFLNSIIPDNYMAEDKKCGKKVGKETVEIQYSIKNKLRIVEDVYKISLDQDGVKSRLINAVKLRNAFVHIKSNKNNKSETGTLEQIEPLTHLYEQLFNFNLDKLLTDIRSFVEQIQPNYTIDL